MKKQIQQIITQAKKHTGKIAICLCAMNLCIAQTFAWSIQEDKIENYTSVVPRIEAELAEVLVVENMNFEANTTPPNPNPTPTQEPKNTPIFPSNKSYNGDNRKYDASKWLLSEKYEELATERDKIVQEQEKEYELYLASAPKQPVIEESKTQKIPETDPETNTKPVSTKQEVNVQEETKNPEYSIIVPEIIVPIDSETNTTLEKTEIIIKAPIEDLVIENPEEYTKEIQDGFLNENGIRTLQVKGDEEYGFQIILDDSIFKYVKLGIAQSNKNIQTNSWSVIILFFIQILNILLLLILYLRKKDKEKKEKNLKNTSNLKKMKKSHSTLKKVSVFLIALLGLGFSFNTYAQENAEPEMVPVLEEVVLDQIEPVVIDETMLENEQNDVFIMDQNLMNNDEIRGFQIVLDASILSHIAAGMEKSNNNVDMNTWGVLALAIIQIINILLILFLFVRKEDRDHKKVLNLNTMKKSHSTLKKVSVFLIALLGLGFSFNTYAQENAEPEMVPVLEEVVLDQIEPVVIDETMLENEQNDVFIMDQNLMNNDEIRGFQIVLDASILSHIAAGMEKSNNNVDMNTWGVLALAIIQIINILLILFLFVRKEDRNQKKLAKNK